MDNSIVYIYCSSSIVQCATRVTALVQSCSVLSYRYSVLGTSVMVLSTGRIDHRRKLKAKRLQHRRTKTDINWFLVLPLRSKDGNGLLLFYFTAANAGVCVKIRVFAKI